MKKYLFVLLFIFLIKFSIGQTHPIVGAWYWSDSTKKTSLFFKQDGSMSMHSGLKGGVIFTKDLRKGTYSLNNSQLTIKWDDNEVEKDNLKFFNKNSFQITFIDKQDKKQKRDFIFIKVVDEEVEKEKP